MCFGQVVREKTREVVSRNGGQGTGWGSERRTDFRSKINKHGMALSEWSWPHCPASQNFQKGPSHSVFLSRSPIWDITYVDAFIYLSCVFGSQSLTYEEAQGRSQ